MKSVEPLIFLIVFIGISVALPSKIGKPRIIGGGDVKPYQFAYQVSLRHVPHNTHFCSGVIVNNDWILSTARCVVGLHKTDVHIWYGSRRLSGPAKVTKVSQIIFHPAYHSKYMENDMALMKTESKIEFDGKLVGPVVMPGHFTKGIESFIVSGWGVKNKNSEDAYYSDVLQMQVTNSITFEECKTEHIKVEKLLHENTSICTKNAIGNGICKGDLGSPLVSMEGELVGLASWWFPGCAEGKPDVYTAVFPYMPWINSVFEHDDQKL